MSAQTEKMIEVQLAVSYNDAPEYWDHSDELTTLISELMQEHSALSHAKRHKLIASRLAERGVFVKVESMWQRFPAVVVVVLTSAKPPVSA